VADKLSEAAAASIDWAANNGVQAALFCKKKTPLVRVGAKAAPCNTEATQWLAVWLDSQLTLQEHHAILLEKGKNAMISSSQGRWDSRRPKCMKVMTVCIQSVAMFGSELWWKSDQTRGTIGRANALQLPVNREGRMTTGKGRSGRPNGHWKTARAPPQELGEPWRAQSSWKSRRPSTRACCRKKRLKLRQRPARADHGTMFTDGSRLGSRAAGFSAVWQSGQSWVGIETRMGYNHEACDAERAALQGTEKCYEATDGPRRVPIFTNARRIRSHDQAPLQGYRSTNCILWLWRLWWCCRPA